MSSSFSQAYDHWLHKNHRDALDDGKGLHAEGQLGAGLKCGMTADFVTIGYVEMDGDEIPESAIRYAILPSRFNPRRNLMVPVALYSNNGAESRFSLVSPTPPRDVPPVVHEPIVTGSVMTRGIVKQGWRKSRLPSRGCSRYPSRGCMRYKPPYGNRSRRHDDVSDLKKVPTILPRGVYDGNTCTAWVFYTLHQPVVPQTAVQTTAAAAEPEPPCMQECADYPAEVKHPRAERGSNDTVMSFLS